MQKLLFGLPSPQNFTRVGMDIILLEPQKFTVMPEIKCAMISEVRKLSYSDLSMSISAWISSRWFASALLTAWSISSPSELRSSALSACVPTKMNGEAGA